MKTNRMSVNGVRLSYKFLLLTVIAAIFVCTGLQVCAKLSPDNKDEVAVTYQKLSEADTYLDLNTGKSFKVIYDALNEVYNRDDLFAFDLYVNSRTRDTMWLDNALVVNNALIRDPEGHFKIDPSKVKRNGNSYKVTTNR